MSKISRASVALAAFLIPSLPAAAQMTSGDMAQGPSLLWVWGWILVVGVIVFVVGTSLAVRGNR
jgi:hypothetical protein